VHQPEAARIAALDALTVERTVAADASHISDQAFTLLQEAEKVAARAITQAPEELSAVIPLAHIQTLFAEHWKKHGDLEQARHWQSKARHLWTDLADQNEFVRSQQLALAKTNF